MATTGSPLWPGASTFPGASVFPGQGVAPIIRARYSTDDASVSIPTWIELTASQMRNFATSTGRDDERSEFTAGNATLTLDNRNRTFDPNNNAAIKPLNRLWLYEEFSGEVHSLIKGYVTAWTQQWPQGGLADATATADMSDEFLVLSQAALPVTTPHRDSYASLAAADNPDGYWDLNEDPTGRTRLFTDPTILPAPRIAGVWVQATPAGDRRGDLRRNIIKPRKR